MIQLALSFLAFTLATANAATPLTSHAEIKAAFAKHRPMVILMSATWCGPCRYTHPHYEAAEKELEGKVDFYTIDVDHISLNMKKGYEGIPAFTCGKTEEEVRSGRNLQVGAMDKDAIVEYILKCTN